MSHLRCALTACAVAAFVACSAPAPQPSPASAPPAMPAPVAADPAAHEAHDAYLAAINSNNLDTLMGMLTDDVVFLAAHEAPMVGKSVVRPWAGGYYDAFTTKWEKPSLEFVVAGEWAFERYNWKSTDTPKAGGAAIVDTGWGLAVYHHDADGKWRVARDSWGPDHK